MKRHPTLKLSLLHVPLAMARASDVPIDEVLKVAGVERIPDERSQETIPVLDLLRAVIYVLDATDDLDRVVQSIHHIPIKLLGLPGFIMRLCPTLGEAYARLDAYQGLLWDGAVATMQRTAEGSLVIELLPLREAISSSSELLAARLMLAVAMGRQLTGEDWAPVAASLPQQTALDEVCAAYLQCPLERRPGPARLVISAQTLELPVAVDQEDMLKFLELEAARRLPAGRSSEPTQSVTTRVRQAQLRQGLAQPLDASQLARTLGLSRRTLFRQLRDEGSSLRGVRDHLQQEAAQTLLRDTDYDHGTIATMVGFSDGRAFARAFRRWTGMTPSQWRDTREDS